MIYLLIYDLHSTTRTMYEVWCLKETNLKDAVEIK
jgi:hypothetical protein